MKTQLKPNANDYALIMFSTINSIYDKNDLSFEIFISISIEY